MIRDALLRLQHALRQHDLLAARLWERYVLHGGSSVSISDGSPTTLPSERTGRRDRRPTKFYELRDNLRLEGGSTDEHEPILSSNLDSDRRRCATTGASCAHSGASCGSLRRIFSRSGYGSTATASAQTIRPTVLNRLELAARAYPRAHPTRAGRLAALRYAWCSPTLSGSGLRPLWVAGLKVIQNRMYRPFV
jgi:hypothetical protein